MTDKRSIKVLPVGGTAFDVSLEGGGNFHVKAKAVTLECATALAVEPRQRWGGLSMTLLHRDVQAHGFRLRLGNWLEVFIACNGHEAIFHPRFEGRDAYRASVTRGAAPLVVDEPHEGAMTVKDFEDGFTGAEERLKVALAGDGEAWVIDVAHEGHGVRLTAPRTVPSGAAIPAFELEASGLDEIVVEDFGLRTTAE